MFQTIPWNPQIIMTARGGTFVFRVYHSARLQAWCYFRVQHPLHGRKCPQTPSLFRLVINELTEQLPASNSGWFRFSWLLSDGKWYKIFLVVLTYSTLLLTEYILIFWKPQVHLWMFSMELRCTTPPSTPTFILRLWRLALGNCALKIHPV